MTMGHNNTYHMKVEVETSVGVGANPCVSAICKYTVTVEVYEEFDSGHLVTRDFQIDSIEEADFHSLTDVYINDSMISEPTDEVTDAMSEVFLSDLSQNGKDSALWKAAEDKVDCWDEGDED